MLTAMTGCGSSTTADSGNAPALPLNLLPLLQSGWSIDKTPQQQLPALSFPETWISGHGAQMMKQKAREGAIEIFISEHPGTEYYLYHHSYSRQCLGSERAAALSSGSAGDVMQMSPDYYGMNTEY